MISFEVLGVDKAIAKFVGLEVATTEAAKVGQEKGAEEVEKRAKAVVPVDTGFLRDSIHVEPDPAGGFLIGSDARYAAAVEFGGPHGAAQPYMRPALDESNLDVFKDVGEALDAAIRAVVGL